MAQRILGLDLGATSVKGVLLETTFRGWTVAGAGSARVAAGEAPLRDRQAAAAKELVAARGWQPDTVIAGFPGTGTASHLVTLPFADPRRIEQTVQYEVEGQIPFDLADVAWDWQVLESHDGKTDLYVGVARREELASLLAALAAAGIDPQVVVPAGPAYAALLGSGALPAEEGEAAGQAGAAEVLLDIGHERTSICVAAGGQCLAARTFAGGSSQLARGLARELSLGEAEASALLEADGGGAPLPPDLAAHAADPRAADALRRGLVPLVRELRATLKAWEARSPRRVSRLWLAGEAARLPGLADVLRTEVAAPAAPVLVTGAAAEQVPPDRAPALALALALALRGQQGSRGQRLNLRRGDLASTRDFEHLRGKLLRLGVYAGLLLLLAIVSSTVKVFALARQENLLDASLCEVTQKVVNHCYTDFSVAESVLRGKGTPTAGIPKISAVDVLAELAARTPGDVPLRFDRVDISSKTLHLVGSTDSAESVDKVVSALRGSRCFADPRSGGVRRRASDGKFDFTIDSELACEGAPAAGGKG
jgi:general secretion pathway protein L